MGSLQSLPELVAAAQANAKALEDRIAGNATQTDGQGETTDHHAAVKALELAAVDIHSVFESRMQHHFKRGPFSRKLKALLLENGKADLADRAYQSYLAINVLKHGKGASYRELLTTRKARFAVTPSDKIATEGPDAELGLVDVTKPGFFDDLTATILEAIDFLEGK
ncbi:hypothetical protein Q4544_06135 [Cognatishimia sp. 1_MG-2023]|uniref:hypothetical protein n=1 Tax=Cognatishimia sp. 1_MG-2023 TaxID=3062642 RepID=UPI0026E2DE7C|nr:hypothetical protein [Cognatishimia sp. 1_MG-2023]MDO6726506.1 hypothetical protein [Cognatishimia sp. 1_MG-2023]